MGRLQFWTTLDNTRACPRLGATVRTSFSSMTASMLVESKPCWISDDMVLSERPSLRNKARNSGSAGFLGSTGRGACGPMGAGAATGAGRGVTGGGAATGTV